MSDPDLDSFSSGGDVGFCSDTEANTANDSVSDSTYDSAADSAYDSAADSASDNGSDSAYDSGSESAGDSSAESAGDSSAESAGDPSADNANVSASDVDDLKEQREAFMNCVKPALGAAVGAGVATGLICAVATTPTLAGSALWGVACGTLTFSFSSVGGVVGCLGVTESPQIAPATVTTSKSSP